ncbi:hypothetical protein R1L06_04265 [Stenotrophomonas sp. C4297]|uniref:hypothetical protein n=1 Tax=Stenotrophomonas sp. C4297 TaxID=3077847 RepID=UPI00293CCAE4|nr:hypothetical protein [Stenotrophomonas sp. C4297]EKT4087169.1 hypothetical protein [Stenotrophomonas maltophilia]MDV3509929.1 hypothetical protein [Stenotrophomonas sp. C4297]HEL4831703.1 hypothetical protein [Stenotrophomonas maltophilia]HEL4834354.1 hypothetical protein [Stenotrophomonas maltophilia]
MKKRFSEEQIIGLLREAEHVMWRTQSRLIPAVLEESGVGRTLMASRTGPGLVGIFLATSTPNPDSPLQVT